MIRWVALSLLAGLGALWLANSSVLVVVPQDQVSRLLAHRGMQQIYTGTDRSADSCHATPIAPSTHDFMANTLPSMRAAFVAGAQVVELDVHLTRDGTFAVFHDWTLDCLTNGTGVTRKHEFQTLRTLDIGYGYSVDGTTFPLRGKGIGLMPSLQEVLEADMDGRFLINFKSNDEAEGRALGDLLSRMGARERVWGVYGGARPTRAATALLSGLRGLDRGALKGCLVRYAVLGWSGFVPDLCRNALVAVPLDYGPFLWGWPHRFTQRMRAAGSEVILWGPYDGSGFSSGIDDMATLAKVPTQFDGYIWTNKVDVIAPALEQLK